MPGIKGLPLVFVMMGILISGWSLSSLNKKLLRNDQDKFVSLFFFAIILSTLSVAWASYSINTAIETLKMVMIYYLIVTTVNSPEKFRIFTWTIVILLTILAGMGILQAYGHDLSGTEMIWAADKQVWQIKGVGIFDNPNDIAYSVVFIVPFSFSLFLNKKKFLYKISALFLMGVSLYCIYLTESRGGVLALIFCLAVWLYYWTSHKKLRSMMLFAGFVMIIMAFSMQVSGYREDASAMGRIEAWSAGMSMLQAHPLIGAGKDQFFEYYNVDSHSSYVRAGAELGIIGLYAWLGILYSTIKYLSGVVRSNNLQWKIYAVSYLSFLGAYSCASIFSTRTYDIVFLTIIAITSAFSRITQEDFRQNNQSLTVNKGSFFNKTVAVITLCVLFIWKLFLIQVW